MNERIQAFDVLLRSLLVEDLRDFSEHLLQGLCRETSCIQGALYVPDIINTSPADPEFYAVGGYACAYERLEKVRFRMGESMAGQVAKTGQPLVFHDLDNLQFEIRTSLVKLYPQTLLIYPILFNNELQGVVELVSLERTTPLQLQLLEKLLESVAAVLQSLLNTQRNKHYLQQLENLNLQLKAQEATLLENAKQLESAQAELDKQLAYKLGQWQHQHALQHALLEGASQAIFTLAATGEVLNVNNRVGSILGFTHAEVIAKPIQQVLGSQAATFEAWQAELAEAKRTTYDYLVRNHEGAVFFCYLELVPLTGVEPYAWVLYLQDVSERYAHFKL